MNAFYTDICCDQCGHNATHWLFWKFMILLISIFRSQPDKRKIQFKLPTSSWLWQLHQVPLLTLKTLILRYTEFDSEIFLYIRAYFVQRPLTRSQKTEESGKLKLHQLQQQQMGSRWLHVRAVFCNRRTSTPGWEGGVPGVAYAASSPPPCGEMQCSLVPRQGEAV